MKIDSQVKVVAAPGVEKAVASELTQADGDLDKLLEEQASDAKDTEDNTESL